MLKEQSKCEQQELGMDIPKCEPPKAVTRRTGEHTEAEDDGVGDIVYLKDMDFDTLRRECGQCEDENGVGLWDLLERLRSDGVSRVHLI